jgi:hypothetical protein
MEGQRKRDRQTDRQREKGGGSVGGCTFAISRNVTDRQSDTLASHSQHSIVGVVSENGHERADTDSEWCGRKQSEKRMQSGNGGGDGNVRIRFFAHVDS